MEANAREHQADPTIEEGGLTEPRRGRGSPPPLPLEARRAIWERVWAKLLAPSATDAADGDAAAGDGGGA
jgi:hypothetical protein